MAVVQLSKTCFLETVMDGVIDTSALVAVIVGESERDRIVELIAGNTFIGPDSMP